MPKTNINDCVSKGWRAEVSWRRQEYVCKCRTAWATGDGVPSKCPECDETASLITGHVQVASVNQHSTFIFPPEERLDESEPFDGWRVTLDSAGIDRMINALADAKRAAFPSFKDPEPGDPVFVRGKILSIDEGVALVDVYRSWPLGMRIPMQCGALDHDERAAEGSNDESGRVRDAAFGADA